MSAIFVATKRGNGSRKNSYEAYDSLEELVSKAPPFSHGATNLLGGCSIQDTHLIRCEFTCNDQPTG